MSMKINDAGLTFRGRLSKRNSTEYIFLHHAAANGSVLAIHNTHLGMGWSGIGYHLYVRKDGTVWKGRPLDTVGAHAGTKYNLISVAICAEGNFQREEMTDIQRIGVTEALAYVQGLYPQAQPRRHKDVDYTACPGQFYPYEEIIIGAKKLTPEPETPAPEPPATAPTDEDCIKLPTLKRGAYGESVKAMQILLIGRGFSCGRWGADGSFGAATYQALNQYKRAVGLPTDGICDIVVWRKILGV